MDLNLILFLIGVIVASVGSVVLKVAAGKINSFVFIDELQFLLLIVSEPILWLGIFLYFVPAVIWVYLLKTIPLTTLQPAMSLTYVVTALISIFILGEAVSVVKWFGILMILIGVAIVSRS